MTGSFFLIFFFDLDLNSFVGYCGILWTRQGRFSPSTVCGERKIRSDVLFTVMLMVAVFFFFFVLFYFFWKLYLILFDFVYVFVYGTFAIPFRYPWEMLQNNNR